MTSNRDIVTDAFNAWMNGIGYVSSIFADEMTWEITGRSHRRRALGRQGHYHCGHHV
jgi:uncharacterized protein